MKWIVFLFCCCCLKAASQTLQYSRHLIRDLSADRMQLVADIEGYHHLISFTGHEEPVIDVFNKELTPVAKRKINIITPEKPFFNILPFHNHYLLYTKTQGQNRYRFFRINSAGEPTEITASLTPFIPAAGNRSGTAIELINQNGQLTLLTYQYTDTLKSIQARITRFNNDYKATHQSIITFPFHQRNEKLLQLALYHQQLFLLKEKKTKESLPVLEVMKLGLDNKKLYSKEFVSNGNPFYAPKFFLWPADSTVLITALLPQSDKKREISYVVFLSRLGDSLQELSAPVLLKGEIHSDLSLNMILPDQRSNGWIPLRPYQEAVRNPSFENNMTDWYPDLSAYQHLPGAVYPYSLPLSLLRTPGHGNYTAAGKIKLTLLSPSFSVLNSLLLKPYKDATVIPGTDLVGFMIDTLPILLIGQQVIRKQKGLALIYPGANSSILLTDTRASTQYEYLTGLTKQINPHHLIVPYRNKKEIGLLRINIKNYLEETQQ
ncbi:MAG TPA: hypothetical protein PLO99_02030 [Chitinophagaceae bacterium]|jgi:hypothetical protein|nr:hypothetical protein [Chitinophagaceae bacterium]